MKSNLLKQLILVTLSMLATASVLNAQTTYCDYPVPSNSGTKVIYMSCQTLGGGEYEIKLESDENISNIALQNVGVNLVGIGGHAIIFSPDEGNNNILRHTFIAPNGVADMYTSAIFINYDGAGEHLLSCQEILIGKPNVEILLYIM